MAGDPDGALTPRQAAALLNVGLPHLARLLRLGAIRRDPADPRRISGESVRDHLRRDDQDRRAAADALTALSRDLGI